MRVHAKSRTTVLAPSVSHGQSLLSSRHQSGTGIQGVTELIGCERTQDELLKSVQDESRICTLSVDGHASVHGKPTLVPGSTIKGKVSCAHTWCRARVKDMASKEAVPKAERDLLALETLQMEGGVCRDERQKRILVADTMADPRFATEKFEIAPAVFPNSGVKYRRRAS